MPIGSNLAQAALDIGLPGSPLTSEHFRARLAAKQTGSISLGELKGATTSMCAAHSWAYGATIANVYTSYVKEQNSNRRDVTFPTATGRTEQAILLCSCNTANVDAFTEIRYPGYCEAGTYNINGRAQLTGVNQSASAPWNVVVVCNTTGWLQGGQSLVYNKEGSVTTDINDNFVVPAGYSYITVICYQLVRISDGARYDTDYNSAFTNMRVRKL